MNALLGDHLGASRDLTVDTVARIEQSMKRHPVAGSMEFTFQRVHIPLGKATDMFPSKVFTVSSRSEDIDIHQLHQYIYIYKIII